MAKLSFWDHSWIALAVLAFMGGRWALRQVRSSTAQSWPVVEGMVESTSVRVEGFGNNEHEIAEVNYSYQVAGEFYSGAHEVGSRIEFEWFPTGSRLVVHYKPSNPSVSFLDREDLRARRARILAEQA